MGYPVKGRSKAILLAGGRAGASRALVLLGLLSAVTAGEVPLGHPDFLPSPQRPIGWRGDGTGCWPAASVVTGWDPDSGANVVWRTPMPAPSFAQPLVVGDKVFTMADPILLICLSVHDGKILWQREIDHTTVMPPEQRGQAQAERRFIAELRRDYGRWREAWMAFEEELKSHGLSLEVMKETAVEAPPAPADKKGNLRPLSRDGDDDEAVPTPAVGKADAGLKTRYLALLKEAQEKAFSFSGGGYRVGLDANPKTPMGQRLIKANRDFDLYASDNWGEPWCSETFATPCCDGRSLYVTTLNNAVARVDLDGTIRWLVWEHLPDRDKGSGGWFNGTGIGTRFVTSPVYYQGKLIINQNGHLRVYDAETGKRLWGIFDPYKAVGGQFPWRPAPEACGVACLTLPLADGTPLPLLTDGRAFFRLEDGGMLAGRFNPVGGTSPMIVNDTLLWKIHPPPRSPLCGAQRFRLVSRDEMAIENVWHHKTGGSGYTNVYHEGRLYSFNVVFDAATGKRSVLDPGLGTSKGQAGIGHCSPVIAGTHLYTVTDCGWQGSSAGMWIFPITGGGAIALAAGYRDERVLKEQEWIWRWGWVGNLIHSSPCVQANRLFFRSKGYLWCFGDPAEPFPVPGKDDPAISASIAAAAAATDLVPQLSGSRARHRLEAVLRLQALGLAGASQAALAKLVASDPSPEVRAAAVKALDAADPAGKPGTAALRVAVTKAFGAERGHPTLTRTLRLGDTAAAELLLSLLGKESNDATRLAALGAIRDLKMTSPALCDAVLALALEKGMVAYAARQALATWPADPILAGRLRAAWDKISDEAGYVAKTNLSRPVAGLGRLLFGYIEANLPADERGAFLFGLAKSSSPLRQDALRLAAEAKPVITGLVAWMTERANAGDVDCIRHLGTAAGPDAAPLLVKMLAAKTTRREAAAALASLKRNTTEAVAALAQALGTATEIEALGILEDLEIFLADPDPAVHGPLVSCLTDQLRNPKATIPVKEKSITTLGRLGPVAKTALPLIKALELSPQRNLAEAAASAIPAIEGK